MVSVSAAAQELPEISTQSHDNQNVRMMTDNILAAVRCETLAGLSRSGKGFQHGLWIADEQDKLYALVLGEKGEKVALMGAPNYRRQNAEKQLLIIEFKKYKNDFTMNTYTRLFENYEQEYGDDLSMRGEYFQSKTGLLYSSSNCEQFMLVKKPAAKPVEAEPEKPGNKKEALPDRSSRIAVQVFTDLSTGNEHAKTADQFTADLLRTLAATDDIEIETTLVSADSVTTGVSHVLKGSVRASGDRLRITAMLVSTENNLHVWSRTFDRTLSQAANIQAEIAAGVAESVSSN